MRYNTIHEVQLLSRRLFNPVFRTFSDLDWIVTVSLVIKSTNRKTIPMVVQFRLVISVFDIIDTIRHRIKEKDTNKTKRLGSKDK